MSTLAADLVLLSKMPLSPSGHRGGLVEHLLRTLAGTLLSTALATSASVSGASNVP